MLKAKISKNYVLKIIVLMVSTMLGVWLIWYTMVREESIDWISGQIIHQAYPYAITQLEDSRVIVGNVVKGFEVTLPAGWQVKEVKHPIFYYSRNEETICEIKSNIINYKEEVDIDALPREQDKYFTKVYAGKFLVLKSQQTTDQGNFISELQIPVANSLIKYTLFAGKENKNKCYNYFEQIRRSFIYYE